MTGGSRCHTTVPNNLPTAAVMPIASAPQKATRPDALSTGAPPVCAATAPRAVRNTSDVPATTTPTDDAGATSAASRGNAAPAANVDADVSAAWTGRALTPSDMRIKTALACALPFRPRLLMLDEPLTGLDPLVRDEFIDRLQRQAGGTTILISSHELAEIEEVTTHVAFVDRGQVRFQEALRDLTARVRRVTVLLAEDAPTPARLPVEWLDVRRTERTVSFIDRQYSATELPAKVTSVLGPVNRIETDTIALRTIYTSLARAARDEQEASA